MHIPKGRNIVCGLFCGVYFGILLAIAFLMLWGCAGWKTMTTTQKVSAAVAYYESFSDGLKKAADAVAVVKPELAQSVAVGKMACTVLDGAVSVLETLVIANASSTEIQEQLKIVDGAAQAANATVGAIVESKS